MRVIATFHEPSAVLGSVRCRLTNDNGPEHLVVAKLDTLEVYSIQSDGLHRECELKVWGKVLTLKAIPINDSLRSNVLVFLDHPEPELLFLSYSETEPGSGTLVLDHRLDIAERNGRPAEFCNDLIVHPAGKLAIVSCYSSRLKVVQLEEGSYKQDFDVIVQHINLLSITFLPVEEYVLAMLFIDHLDRLQLVARDVDVEEYELSKDPSLIFQSTALSSKDFRYPADQVPMLLPVPSKAGTIPTGGVLVVGGRKILLFEVADEPSQKKQRGKRKRTDRRKSSAKGEEVTQAIQKEKEREGRKRKPLATVQWPWAEVKAVCPIADCRTLIGDSFGKLALLTVENLNTHGIVIVPLGETSPSTSITHLANQVIYIGSFLGDPQVVRISPVPVSALGTSSLPVPSDIRTKDPSVLSSSKGKHRAVDEEDQDLTTGCIIDSKGSYVEVLASYTNVGPIHDAVLVDVDASGQHEIVTCSGGQNTGSLNVIRTGADFEELAAIPGLLNVTHIWPLRTTFGNREHNHLVVSTLHSTSIFHIDSRNAISTIDSATIGFATGSRTIFAGNVVHSTSASSLYEDSAYIVQVTPERVILLEYDQGLMEYTRVDVFEVKGYQADILEVVAASASPSQVLLAYRGGEITILTVVSGKFVKTMDKTRVTSGTGIDTPQSLNRDEISAVCCTPINPEDHSTRTIAVAFWHTNRIRVFKLQKGELPNRFVPAFKCETLRLAAPVRSLLFYNFGLHIDSGGSDNHPYLLAGLADGSVVSFTWRDKMGAAALVDTKTISFGNAPVSLALCPVDGKPAVLAAGSRASIISCQNGRLTYSPVMLKDVTFASAMNTAHYPLSMVLSNDAGLFIGRVKDLKKMHFRSISFGFDNPRRIIHAPSLHAFGVACSRSEPVRVGDPESSGRHSFKLLDEGTLRHLAQFTCEVNEEISAAATLPLGSLSVFAVGSYYFDPTEREPTRGRILIFESSDASPLSLKASAEVNGCVYSIVHVNGCLAAAINSSVTLFRLERSDTSFALKKVADWNHNYLVSRLAVYGNRLAVGDQISSVSLLEIGDTGTIRTLARDYGPLWPICIELFDENAVIGANDALNLFSFALSSGSSSSLVRDGFYHLGEIVTKFIRGSLASSELSSQLGLQSKHVFFTASGRIGVVIEMGDDHYAKHLVDLQRNMGGVITGGTIEATHAKLRAPKNSRGRSDNDEASYGFLDGDFLEELLKLAKSEDSVAKVEEIFSGGTNFDRLEITKDGVIELLQALQDMH